MNLQGIPLQTTYIHQNHSLSPLSHIDNNI